MNIYSENFEENIRRDLEHHDRLMQEVSNNIFANLRDNVSHRRRMTTDVAIVSGALASFSLLVLNISSGYSRIFLVFAILLLLGIIGLSILSLRTTIVSEYNELMKLLNHYSEMDSMIRGNMVDVLKDKNIEKYNKTIKEIREKFNPAQAEEANKEPLSEIYDIVLIVVFPLALILIGLSLLFMIIQ